MPSDETGKTDAEKKVDRKPLIEGVTSPLNFFALMVVACEGIIGTVCVKSKLTGDQQFFIVKGMMYLFGSLTGVAGILTWLKPRHLSVEMAKALEQSEQAEREARIARAEAERSKELLGSTGFKGMLEDIVDRQIEQRLLEERKGDE